MNKFIFLSIAIIAVQLMDPSISKNVVISLVIFLIVELYDEIKAR